MDQNINYIETEICECERCDVSYDYEIYMIDSDIDNNDDLIGCGSIVY